MQKMAAHFDGNISMVISTNYKDTNKYEKIIDYNLTIYKLLHRDKKK